VIVWAGFAFAAVVLTIIVSLLLRRQLREKYAVMWLLIGIALLAIAFFPGLLLGLTNLLGVEVPANLLFSIAIALLIGVALHLSWELSRAEDEIRKLAEESAILRSDVDRLLAAQATASQPVPEDQADDDRESRA
tara:strand:- start:1949 stop:2353 length:405 start_codon:yes stop_codon:yes gene_type:complete